MRKILPFLAIFIAVLLLYHPVLTTYFSQDDFFHFKVSQTDGTVEGFVNLFGFHPFEERGIAFYRPIFREALYNTYYNIFGLNHIPFRVLSFIIHFVNIFLVYILVLKIFQKKYLSFFVAFFFGISSANVATLYYLAGGIQALGATMFILLTLIFFVSFLETNNIKYAISSFLTFSLSLGSHELATTTPILLTGLIFVYLPLKKSVARVRVLIPFFVILSIYLYLNITKIGFSSQEQQYQVILNIKTLFNSLMWYSGWALGLPEMLIDFVFPRFKLNPTLMRYWGNFYSIIFSTFIVAITMILSTIVYLFLKKRAIFKNKKIWFFIFWFPISLLPVLLLPAHKSTYYLTSALPAFWTVVGLLCFNAYWDIQKRWPKMALTLMLVFCATLSSLSITSTILGHTTYWAATRGKLAKKLITQVVAKYPTLPKGVAIYFTNDPTYPYVAGQWGSSSKQASLVLNGSDALQLLYKDPTLHVFYEDFGGMPKNFPQEKLYTIVAEIK